MRFPTSVAIFLLFLFPALNPCTSHAGAEEADRLYSLGRERIAAGEYRQAERAFAQAVVENPLHGEALLQLASLHSRNILTYGKAEDILFSMPEVAGRIGGKGRDDLLFRAGVSMGKLYVKSGRSAQAVALLRNVIASAPSGAPLDEAYATLGLAHYYERLYDDAIFEMRKAIKINPNHANAKFNLKTIRSRLEHFQAGKLFSRLGDRRRAVAEYRKAIDLDPRFIEARHRLGVELYLAGNAQEALKELRRASLVTADYRKAFEIRYAEGVALLRLDRTGEAMGKFELTVQARPTFAPAHNEMGKILLEREEYDAAIDHFVKAIGADPKAEYARGLQVAMSRKAKKQAGKTPK
ncbi:MAG: tetratricopeptide repeat protein [Deltaproteobacteria bacterium]|nr:tetratricopeptide repeat protein [Deltaproteobacteria bacterium]